MGLGVGTVVAVGGTAVGVVVGMGVAVGCVGVGGINVGRANGGGVGAGAVTLGEQATVPRTTRMGVMANTILLVNCGS